MEGPPLSLRNFSVGRKRKRVVGETNRKTCALMSPGERGDSCALGRDCSGGLTKEKRPVFSTPETFSTHVWYRGYPEASSYALEDSRRSIHGKL